VSGVSPTVNPTFPNGVPPATARTNANNNNAGAAVVSGTLPSDPNRLLLLESGEETGMLRCKAVPFSVPSSSVQQ
jgi:hypothetical protein